MTRQLLAASLSALILAQSPAAAVAQVVSAPVRIPAGAMNAGIAAAGVRTPGLTTTLSPTLTAPTLSVAPALAAPTLLPRLAAPAVAVQAAPVISAAAVPAAVAAAHVEAVKSVRAMEQPAASVQHGALGVLTETVRREARAKEAPAASGVSFNLMFDGARRAAPASDPVFAGEASVRSNALAPASLAAAPRAGVTPAAPAAPKAAHRAARTLTAAALAAAGMFLFPSIALAAAPAAGAASFSAQVLATVHPAASLVAAVVGAVVALIMAYRRPGPPPSPGEVLASMLRYGVLAGAGVYVLGDLGSALIIGFPAGGLTPLPSAVATAALGQGAFQGKWGDAETTPADRLMSAFPAVAGALGFSVGVTLAAASPLLSLATHALAVTGLAAAFYSALYKPGVSDPQGPNAMARGYVLQALMSGLALAVTSPWLVWPLLGLAAWGFGQVLYTAGRAVWAAISPRPTR